jgi:hypothetical protein
MEEGGHTKDEGRSRPYRQDLIEQLEEMKMTASTGIGSNAKRKLI